MQDNSSVSKSKSFLNQFFKISTGIAMDFESKIFLLFISKSKSASLHRRIRKSGKPCFLGLIFWIFLLKFCKEIAVLAKKIVKNKNAKIDWCKDNYFQLVRAVCCQTVSRPRGTRSICYALSAFRGKAVRLHPQLRSHRTSVCIRTTRGILTKLHSLLRVNSRKQGN